MSFFSPSSHRASSRRASSRRLPARPLALLTPVAVLAVLAGCASPQPHPYADLASTPVLRPNPSDERGHMPYRLPKTVDWGQYGAVIVEPVIVYRGADHQFEDLSEDDKVVLAGDMRRAFAEDGPGEVDHDGRFTLVAEGRGRCDRCDPAKRTRAVLVG